jgi:four helix bundle protein
MLWLVCWFIKEPKAVVDSSYEQLDVYQLATSLADDVWMMVDAWSQLEQKTIGIQLIRSVESVGANIAEGAGRGSRAENRRFLFIARGSLYETKHWLRRAWTQDLIAKRDLDILKPKVDELIPRLNAYLNYVSRQC